MRAGAHGLSSAGFPAPRDFLIYLLPKPEGDQALNERHVCQRSSEIAVSGVPFFVLFNRVRKVLKRLVVFSPPARNSAVPGLDISAALQGSIRHFR